jgi:hypothetical protein
VKLLIPAKTAKRLLRVAEYVFAAVGVLALGYWATGSERLCPGASSEGDSRHDGIAL